MRIRARISNEYLVNAWIVAEVDDQFQFIACHVNDKFSKY